MASMASYKRILTLVVLLVSDEFHHRRSMVLQARADSRSADTVVSTAESVNVRSVINSSSLGQANRLQSPAGAAWRNSTHVMYYWATTGRAVGAWGLTPDPGVDVADQRTFLAAIPAEFEDKLPELGTFISPYYPVSSDPDFLKDGRTLNDPSADRTNQLWLSTKPLATIVAWRELNGLPPRFPEALPATPEDAVFRVDTHFGPDYQDGVEEAGSGAEEEDEEEESSAEVGPPTTTKAPAPTTKSTTTTKAPAPTTKTTKAPVKSLADFDGASEADSMAGGAQKEDSETEGDGVATEEEEEEEDTPEPEEEDETTKVRK